MTDLGNREKLVDLQDCPPIVTVHVDNMAPEYPQDVSFWQVLEAQSDE